MLKSTYEKVMLYKIRQIIINEFNNPYYTNGGNILEIIDLGSERIEASKLKYVEHINNMVIYKNGFIKFNNFVLTLRFFPEIESITTTKCCLNSKVKKKTKKGNSNKKRKKK